MAGNTLIQDPSVADELEALTEAEEDILRLSKTYIKALRDEESNKVGGDATMSKREDYRDRVNKRIYAAADLLKACRELP